MPPKGKKPTEEKRRKKQEEKQRKKQEENSPNIKVKFGYLDNNKSKKTSISKSDTDVELPEHTVDISILYFYYAILGLQEINFDKNNLFDNDTQKKIRANSKINDTLVSEMNNKKISEQVNNYKRDSIISLPELTSNDYNYDKLNLILIYLLKHLKVINKIYLNGTEIKIKDTCYIKLTNADDIVKKIEKIKTKNINIREIVTKQENEAQAQNDIEEAKNNAIKARDHANIIIQNLNKYTNLLVINEEEKQKIINNANTIINNANTIIEGNQSVEESTQLLDQANQLLHQVNQLLDQEKNVSLAQQQEAEAEKARLAQAKTKANALLKTVKDVIKHSAQEAEKQARLAQEAEKQADLQYEEEREALSQSKILLQTIDNTLKHSAQQAKEEAQAEAQADQLVSTVNDVIKHSAQEAKALSDSEKLLNAISQLFTSTTYYKVTIIEENTDSQNLPQVKFNEIKSIEEPTNMDDYTECTPIDEYVFSYDTEYVIATNNKGVKFYREKKPSINKDNK